MWLESISDFKINLEISELMPIGGVANANALVVKLGCMV